jgi:hypothetical protein
VAEQSTTLVESAFVARAEARRRSGAPPALKTRDNRTVVEPKTPVKPPSSNTTPPEFRKPPQEEEVPAVATPQSDQPSTNPTPANQAPVNNEPQLKTRPAQRPADQQPPADSQQQNAPQQQQNNKPPQGVMREVGESLNQGPLQQRFLLVTIFDIQNKNEKVWPRVAPCA